MRTDSDLPVMRSDITADLYSAALVADRVAWDIETSGLDWSSDEIGTCQIALDGRSYVVILDRSTPPQRLASLLSAPEVQKVFHHAPFDLRFLVAKWEVEPRNIACTKVASKIVEPHLDRSEHSLKPALERHLGVTISKREQVSDWLGQQLSQEQVAYARSDVAHLLELAAKLEHLAERLNVIDLVRASWDYLPTRAQLDVLGSGDVFTY